MKKCIIFALAMVSVILISVGCSKDDEDNSFSTDEKRTTSGTYPFTGLEGKGIDNRMIGVMVNNHPKARPQTGLSKADIVFEILAEGNITRFLALYQSEYPDVVGPVRSAREYYFDLADRYDAMYIHHGAANFINDMIEERGIDRINGSHYDNDGKLFKRASSRKAPHNSYLQFGAIADVASEKGYELTKEYAELPFLTEDEMDNLSGERATTVEITYFKSPSTTVSYEYDETNEVYYRLNDGEQTVELETDASIQLDNIFIVETTHEVIDSEGRRAVDLDSGGNAYLLQKGTIQKVEWENKDGRILPIKDGETVGFVPGKTWINVVPTNPGLEQAITIINE